jgi:hypothetical protein
VHYQSEPFTRIGVDGVGKVLTGIRGRQFEAVVEEDVISYAYAMGLLPLYHALPNTGARTVVYNGINYLAAYSHLYLIDSVEVQDCKRMPRLTGPNYDFIGGARITLRWMMTPYYLNPQIEEED